MKNYATGLETQEKILKTCKNLFYKKGYNETTFAEICKKANVNPGSIAYHFTNKFNIASKIYENLMQQFYETSLLIFPEQDELQQIMLALGLHLKLVFNDSAYRRFIWQYYLSKKESSRDNFDFTFSKVHEKPHSIMLKRMNKRRTDFYHAASEGMDGYIELYIDKHINELDFTEGARYYYELHYLFLNYDELTKRIDKALDLLDTIDIKLDKFNIAIENR